ncbi:MAG: universal stress protein [Kineosporiaceae bacterium]
MDARPTVSRIVIGYDGSKHSQAALDTAIEEARVRGVDLLVVNAIDPLIYLPGREHVHETASQQAVQDAYARAAAVLGETRVHTHVEPGSPSSVLLRQTGPEDLVIVGSHGFRPVAQMLVGSTSEAVAGHAQGPVLVVRHPTEHPHGHVVVGVDGSAAGTRALALAVDMAARDGGTVRAVMSVPPVIDAAGIVSGPDEPALQKASDDLHAAVEGVTAATPGVTVEEHVVQLHPAEALLEHAKGARMVVVGSRGRGGFAALVLGSVSRRLVHVAPCPVLVVHGSR